MHKLLVSDSAGYLEYSPNGLDGGYQVANLVMRLLLSKNGVVLRRLLITAVRTMIYIIVIVVFSTLLLWNMQFYNTSMLHLFGISTGIFKLHAY